MSDDQIEVIEEPGFDRVERVDLQLEMQRSYLDYAMSVIVGRACRTYATASSPYTAAFFTPCTTAVTAPTRLSLSLRVWWVT